MATSKEILSLTLELLDKVNNGTMTTAEMKKILEETKLRNNSEKEKSLSEYVAEEWEKENVEILVNFCKFFLDIVGESINLSPDVTILMEKFPKSSIQDCLLTFSTSFGGKLAAKKRKFKGDGLLIDGEPVVSQEYVAFKLLAFAEKVNQVVNVDDLNQLLVDGEIDTTEYTNKVLERKAKVEF